ncbi:gag protease polyprotein [Cucumis melo var. makuwa]|uniref:Gag protease polyprotein n=1 Tax=Cucumis melo var. makuwa TaxID=1194695 RepID=A0A5A7UYY7_CUCMM|nr:gag protease polyprotein [Cucumis melo var. makuwa]
MKPNENFVTWAWDMRLFTRTRSSSQPFVTSTPRRHAQSRLIELECYVAANGRISMTIALGAEKPISPYVADNTSRSSRATSSSMIKMNRFVEHQMVSSFKEFWGDCHRSNHRRIRLLDKSSLTIIAAGQSHFYNNKTSLLNKEESRSTVWSCSSKHTFETGRSCPRLRMMLIQPLTTLPPPSSPSSQSPPCVLRLTVSANAQQPSVASRGREAVDQPQTYWSKTWSYLSFLKGIRELTPKFSGSAAGLFGDNLLYSGSVTASCSLCAIVCNELFTDRHRCPDVLCIVVMLVGYVVNWNCMSVDFKVLMLGKGTTRGRPTRSKKDALTYDVSLCFCVLMAKTILATRQPVAQATDPAAPVTHADFAAMEQRFRDLIMQMREQQQPAPHAPAPAPVVPQVVQDQLSAEAKHLRDFRKYNPTTFDGSLEDPTRAQLWLSSLETIFWYMKCPEDQKVQCAVFMLTDRGTA